MRGTKRASAALKAASPGGAWDALSETKKEIEGERKRERQEGTEKKWCRTWFPNTHPPSWSSDHDGAKRDGGV